MPSLLLSLYHHCYFIIVTRLGFFQPQVTPGCHEDGDSSRDCKLQDEKADVFSFFSE
jgi:hypothetical protein